MPLLILLIVLIGGPILELSVLVDVAREIGTLPAVGATILTAIVGLYIVRLQGFVIMRRMHEAAGDGRPPVAEMVHGFFLFIAGICLFLPGFITDAIGILLLIPPVRLVLGRIGLHSLFFGQHPATVRRTGFDRSREEDIIEGDYTVSEERKPPDQEFLPGDRG